jgi:hypothetical protein
MPLRLDIAAVSAAIEERSNPDGTISKQALKDATVVLYGDALDAAQAEADAAHDAAVVAKIREIQASYPTLKASGIPAIDVAGVIAERNDAIGRHEARLAEDVQRWEAWRGVILGGIEAAATVAISGGNPVAIGTALIPAFNAVQEIAGAMGKTVTD